MNLPFDITEAEQHLAGVDERIGGVIAAYRPCTWTLRPLERPFESLLRSIVFQQLSTPSAAAIYGRVEDLFSDGRPDPKTAIELDDEAFRGAGVSRQKIRYIRDLAEKTLDGTIPDLEELKAMGDREILDRLCLVKGIGRWTVEMLLIFSLGRPDILPSTDLVIRRGFKELYGREELPSVKELDTYGEKWRPYRSVASWYIWRYIDGDNEAW